MDDVRARSIIPTTKFAPPRLREHIVQRVSLSGRELEVLELLPSGLTVREIGAELFLSRNTVKTYLRGIYRELDVSSRDDAVTRARQLGLLPRA